MSRQASPAPAATMTLPHDALAPDLLALFLGATPHPDVVIPERQVTIADLAAAARAARGAGAEAGAEPAVLRWDAAGQRFAS